MNNNLKLLVAVIVGAVLSFVYLYPFKANIPLKGAVGLDSVQATSSRLELIGGTVQTLIGTSTCNARIITTKASPILLTFSEKVNTLPSSTSGHLQVASTTVSYTSEEYGCGKVKALTADGLGSFITILETQ